MRTIKFRGQREDTKEWVYGSLIEDKYIVGNVIDWNEDYFNTECWWRVIPKTVGQFTGLYDKNGTEIYEGDIIKEFNGYGSDNGIAKIEYDTATFDLGARHEYRQTICGFIAKAIDNQKYNSESSTQSFYEKECEVIGNIHDNKEIK